MEELIKDLERRKEEALLGGGQAKIDLQHSLGRLTARERVEKLADPGTFMEFGMLNHSDVPGMEEKSAGDGIICGIGKVDGRPAVIQASDKTVLAATEGAVHFRKAKMMHEYAVRRGFPIFSLGEGGGLRMPDGMGSDGISDKLFPMTLLRHGREVPFIASIMGDSFGGPTWTAVTADFCVQVKGTCMAVSGPRMLELASGEAIDPEALGGWQMHAQYTGQADAFADNDGQCIRIMKEFFSYMPSHAEEDPPFRDTGDNPCRRVDEVVKIVPTARYEGYDMKALISSIVDGGAFFELKELYGPALITGLARLDGRVAGIIANQPMHSAGSAGPDECDKAIEFICLCDSYNIPMVFLHDIPGFRISSYAEQRKALWDFDSAPYKAAGKHLIDDVIDPRDTRRFLCRALEYACHKNGGKSRRLLANWPTGY